MGAFDPVKFRRAEHHKSTSVPSTLAYACSIEYGAALLEAEGVRPL